MIIDASAIVALAAGESSAGWIRATLDAHASTALRMPWVNIAECGMVLERAVRGSSNALETALAAIGVEALEADYKILRLAIDARARYPLNFGDCFAYAHARARNEALLTLDDDFLATDLVDVLHPGARSRRKRSR